MGQVLAAVAMAAVMGAVIAGFWLIPVYWKYSEKIYSTFAMIGIYGAPLALGMVGFGLVNGAGFVGGFGALLLLVCAVFLVLAILNRKPPPDKV